MAGANARGISIPSTLQEYKLALWQCYERYLQHFGEVNVEEITDVDIFRQTFFPGGFDGDNAGLTVGSWLVFVCFVLLWFVGVVCLYFVVVSLVFDIMSYVVFVVFNAVYVNVHVCCVFIVAFIFLLCFFNMLLLLICFGFFFCICHVVFVCMVS